LPVFALTHVWHFAQTHLFSHSGIAAKLGEIGAKKPPLLGMLKRSPVKVVIDQKQKAGESAGFSW